MNKFFIIPVLLGLLACNTNKPAKENQHIYWVNSLKVSCVGLAPMQCLQIQKGEDFVAGEWKNFYTSIEGFDYETGFIYKLLVEEEQLDPASVPAGASTIRCSLVKVLEKEQDPVILLNDIWALRSLKGMAFEIDKQKDGIEVPTLEMKLGDRLYYGTDGCNNYQGKIDRIDNENLLFGIAAGTRKMCMDMLLPDQFSKALNQVRTYKLNGLELILYDGDSKELMVFQKTD